MEKHTRGLLCVLITLCVTIILLHACKGKSDNDIKTAIETLKGSHSQMANIAASVKDGVVTLTGECKDDACRTSCEDYVKNIAGVKQVINNCSLPAAPAIGQPQVSVTVDDQLVKSVTDAIKDFSEVKASVNEGVVTLTGAIKRQDLQKLIVSLHSLKPKKIDNQLTIK